MTQNTLRNLSVKARSLNHRINKLATYGAPLGNKNAAGPHDGIPNSKSPASKVSAKEKATDEFFKRNPRLVDQDTKKWTPSQRDEYSKIRGYPMPGSSPTAKASRYSPQLFKGTTTDTYKAQEMVRGWNGKQNPITVGGTKGGAMLARRLPTWGKSQHLAASAQYAKEASRLSAIYSSTLDKAAQATWGRKWHPTDYRISGIGSDDFSDVHKNQLRSSAQGSTFARDAADLHKHASRYAK